MNTINFEGIQDKNIQMFKELMGDYIPCNIIDKLI